MPGFHRRTARIVAVAFFTLLAAFASAGSFTAAAQDTPAPDPTVDRLTVAAVLCPDIDCIELGERLGGFEISAIDTGSSEVLANCVTDAATQTAGCVLEIPAGVTYELAWDNAQVPTGHAYVGYQVNSADGPAGTITYLPFYPVQGNEPTPIPEPGHMVVQAALCTDASCDEFASFLDSFVLTAVDPDTGEKFSSCATGNLQQALAHQCILDIPADGDVELEWFADQVPTGYVYAGYQINTADGPGGTVTTIPFAPVSGDEPDVTPVPTSTPGTVTSLPVTGTGATVDTPDARPAGLVAIAVLAMAGLGASLCWQAMHRRR